MNFKQLVITEPYASMGPIACANALNVATVEVYALLESTRLNRWAANTLTNARVKDVYDGTVVPADQTANGGPDSETIRANCIELWHFMLADSGEMDINATAQLNRMQALATGIGTIIPSAAMANLLARATETVPLMSTIEGRIPRPRVGPGDVIQARA